MFQKVKSNIDISFKEKFLLPNGFVWSLPVIPTLTMKITATLDTKAIVKIVYITYKYHPVDKGTLFISMKMLLAPKGPETRGKAAAHLIILTLLVIFLDPLPILHSQLYMKEKTLTKPSFDNCHEDQQLMDRNIITSIFKIHMASLIQTIVVSPCQGCHVHFPADWPSPHYGCLGVKRLWVEVGGRRGRTCSRHSRAGP